DHVNEALSSIPDFVDAIVVCDPDAIPKNAAKKMTPVAIEYAAHPRCSRTANRRANTKLAAISDRNPIAPLTKCMKPCQLIAWASAGVPGGKPKAGSAVNAPALIRPSP